MKKRKPPTPPRARKKHTCADCAANAAVAAVAARALTATHAALDALTALYWREQPDLHAVRDAISILRTNHTRLNLPITASLVETVVTPPPPKETS